MLQRSDLFLYLEGGRSYSGELKPFKTGLLHAAAQARRTDVVVIPVAIAYDLILEDFVLSRQRIKRQQRPFAREAAEMLRYAVGYKSRAIVSFGAPIQLSDYDPDDRRSMGAPQAPTPRIDRPPLHGRAHGAGGVGNAPLDPANRTRG